MSASGSGKQPKEKPERKGVFRRDGKTARSTSSNPPWTVLIVDDDPPVHDMTALVLRGFEFKDRAIHLLHAYSASEARRILEARQDIAVAFVDVVMEHDSAGLALVREVRDELANREIQLILRTGQPGLAPELDVLLQYEINDYCHKAELTRTRLLTALVSALRNYDRVVLADQLLNQQKVAASVQEAKSLFFAQASHELRTPVSGMIGLCELLAGTALTEEQMTYVTHIEDSARLLLALVNDILDFSKLQAGKFELQRTDFNLRQLTESVVHLLKPLCAEDVELRVMVSEEVPDRLSGDPVRIRQILNNLIGNALKFTTKGYVELSVTRDHATDNKHVILRMEVRDTGIGIPASQCARLFDAYEQVAGPKASSGTGLGLSISKKLCQLMGGDIQVTSTVGKGTTFAFSLVLEPAMAAAPAGEGHPVPGHGTDGLSPRCHRILVVDDNPTNRLIARKTLAHWGFDVLLAESGRQALSLLSREAVDLVLLDCQMPGMSGHEVARRIRASGAVFSKLPLIACSATNDPAEIQQCLKSGMNDFVSKPLEREALREMLGKWLGYRSFMA